MVYAGDPIRERTHQTPRPEKESPQHKEQTQEETPHTTQKETHGHRIRLRHELK